MTETDSTSPQTNASHGVEVQRLVRRCAIYNTVQGTEFTPEGFAQEIKLDLPLADWNRGWEMCEASFRSVAAHFRKEAEALKKERGDKAAGAAIAYANMATMIENLYPAPNAEARQPRIQDHE